MKTLLVDANKNDRAWLRRQLSADGHEIAEAEDGVSAAQSLERSPYSLVVTDWMLRDMTGLELVQIIKRSPESRSTHVLMVSQRADASSVAKALENGVDDYLVKPCEPEELIARARAVLRRPANQATTDALTVGPVTLDKAGHKVSVGSNELSLSPVEFRLINFFMENPGRVFDRQQLLDQVWRRRNGIGERTVDVHVRRLRAALEPHDCQHLVQTVRGFGYRFG